MSETIEWKTIRIDAGSYYKLTELSGLWTFILGSQVSLSDVAKSAISDHYLRMYPKLTDLISNPAELKRRKEYAKKSLSDLAKSSDKDVAQVMLDAVKVLEDRERDGG